MNQWCSISIFENMSIKELTKEGYYFYCDCSARILHVSVRHYNLPDDKDTIYGRNMRDDHASQVNRILCLFNWIEKIIPKRF